MFKINIAFGKLKSDLMSQIPIMIGDLMTLILPVIHLKNFSTQTSTWFWWLWNSNVKLVIKDSINQNI